ncbi:Modification methylase HhaI [Bienertia sinuspersici]
MDIRCIEDKMFTFQFFRWRDKERVMEGQPWNFDRHAICLSELMEDGKPSEVQLHSMRIWVRFYNLSFIGRSSKDNIKMLAKKVGTFVKLDKTSTMEIEKLIRVNILVDLRWPFKLKVRGGDSMRIPLKYERLPLFCFICGRLGHFVMIIMGNMLKEVWETPQGLSMEARGNARRG